jgi:hypothetical protein
MSDLEIVMPDFSDEQELPDVVLILVACAMRYYDDPTSVQDQLAWLAIHEACWASRARGANEMRASGGSKGRKSYDGSIR